MSREEVIEPRRDCQVNCEKSKRESVIHECRGLGVCIHREEVARESANLGYNVRRSRERARCWNTL
eukprot:9479162-Pyramimonas_sp.AAC.1